MKYIKNRHIDKFNEVYNLIISYINDSLASVEQINEYVPNSHLAETFKQYLVHSELENKFPNEYEKRLISDNLLSLFDKEKLEKDGIIEIHRVYQELREKKNFIRNTFKLANIEISTEYSYGGAYHFHPKLKSFKIKI
jgi:hypothetical protein